MKLIITQKNDIILDMSKESLNGSEAHFGIEKRSNAPVNPLFYWVVKSPYYDMRLNKSSELDEKYHFKFVIDNPCPELVFWFLDRTASFTDDEAIEIINRLENSAMRYDKNTCNGTHTSKFKEGTVFIDRFGEAYFITRVYENKAYVMGGGGHTYKIVDLSEFRDNLKHQFARKGIRCYFQDLKSPEIVGLINQRYVKNKMINSLSAYFGADLRTNKDKGISYKND